MNRAASDGQGELQLYSEKELFYPQIKAVWAEFGGFHL